MPADRSGFDKSFCGRRPARQSYPDITLGDRRYDTPAYYWNADPNSTWYYLWVNDSTGNGITQWVTAAQAGCYEGTGSCSVRPDFALAKGSARWWIQTWNPSGDGPWSDGMVFTVPDADPPGKAALISPSGTSGDITPTYTWNADPNSTWYYLWVNDGTGNGITQWVTAAQAACYKGAGSCSATPDVALAPGSAKWWIQTWSPNGDGPWSDGMAFTVPATAPPGKAALTSPSGTIGTNTPNYTWQADPYSTSYYLWVNDSTGNRLQKWYRQDETGCLTGGEICSVTADIALAPGAAQWWIQTWNSDGYGPWSDAMVFTVPAPVPPGKCTLASPSGTIGTNTPNYTWQAEPNSTSYYLWVNDSTGIRYQKWFTASRQAAPAAQEPARHRPAFISGRVWPNGGFKPGAPMVTARGATARHLQFRRRSPAAWSTSGPWADRCPRLLESQLTGAWLLEGP